jgi:hypothetical protein
LRIDYDELPDPVRVAVESRTGVIRSARSADAGINSAVAAVLDTEASGPVFLKGLPDDDVAVINQLREARVSPHVEGIGPRMLWQDTVGGWDLIAFEFVEDARPVDYTPGSPDLAKFATVMGQLAKTPCPNVQMMTAGWRWGAYLDNTADYEILEGDAFLHTDYNVGNVLITEDRAWLVDWAWATRGAAFIDPALVMPRLIAAGHSPDDAEAWAAQHPAWHEAAPDAITKFAAAISRLWSQLADKHPDATWRRPLAESAATWADHRAATA